MKEPGLLTRLDPHICKNQAKGYRTEGRASGTAKKLEEPIADLRSDTAPSGLFLQQGIF